MKTKNIVHKKLLKNIIQESKVNLEFRTYARTGIKIGVLFLPKVATKSPSLSIIDS